MNISATKTASRRFYAVVGLILALCLLLSCGTACARPDTADRYVGGEDYTAPIILLSVVEYDEYGEGVICREITDFSAWLSRIRLPVLVAYLPWEGDQGAEIIPILEDRTLLFEDRACFVIVREEVDDEVLENMLRPPAQSLILVHNTFEIARKDEITAEDARTMLIILEEYIRSESGKASE